MFDKRVAKGSTYAAMVIPAGTNPDTMMMEKKQEERKKNQTLKVSLISYIFREEDSQICQEKYTLTEIYQLQNLSQEEPTLMYKLRST